MPQEKNALLSSRPISSVTNERWALISSSSGLPDEARAEVERAIDLYRVSAIDVTPAQLREELINLKNKVSILRQELEEFSSTPHGAVALALGLRVNQEPEGLLDPALARSKAARVVVELRLLADWLTLAARSIKGGQRGARQASIRIKFLVLFLDDILFRFRNRRISRSSKRNSPVHYIRAACAAADPSISNASIEEAMKQIINTRRKIESGTPDWLAGDAVLIAPVSRQIPC
jgi:hypothetical protein